ncbi:hypothetical protein L210DRAFT_988009 [Boletus edulis BED1]|uniref:Uncharacterized protein n=1 Tax=Boletus edulis BED1 TaxID=1328754 RepID=A0AAD4BPE8_BOLED|nr:hypothetical protein L210DRAFT_988009 [Boletus edulis BED1]
MSGGHGGSVNNFCTSRLDSLLVSFVTSFAITSNPLTPLAALPDTCTALRLICCVRRFWQLAIRTCPLSTLFVILAVVCAAAQAPHLALGIIVDMGVASQHDSHVRATA